MEKKRTVSPAISAAAAKSRKRRITARIDNRAIYATLNVSALLLWVGYAIAALYVVYCDSFFLQTGERFVSVRSLADGGAYQTTGLSSRYGRLYYLIFPKGFDLVEYIPAALRVLAFSAVACGGTYFLAVHYENGGELLMVLAWVLGVLSERYWMTSAAMSWGAAAAATPTGAGSSNFTATASAAASSAASAAAGGGASAGATASMGGAAAAAAAAAGGGSVVLDRADLLLYDKRVPSVPGWMWLAVAIITGLFSGIMCKVKDILDGKIERGYRLLNAFGKKDDVAVATAYVGGCAAAAEDGDEGAGSAPSPPPPRIVVHTRTSGGGDPFNSMGLGARLYMVVPFCTGQWFAFILRHGWRGIIVENSMLVLTMGMIGYTMLSYKVLRQQVYRVAGRTSVVRYRRTVPATESGAEPAVVEEEEVETTVDIIDLISKIFTTSFGAVAFGVLVLNVLITTLAIPFFKVLFRLNALVSSVGILVELFVYELV